MTQHTKSGAFRRRSSYFNTTGVDGRALTEFETTARSQEDRVLALFMRNPARELTPEDVNQMAMAKSPRHSVSRAMRNLTDEGFIVKTTRQAAGIYGRPIHYWRLQSREPEQLRLVG